MIQSINLHTCFGEHLEVENVRWGWAYPSNMESEIGVLKILLNLGFTSQTISDVYANPWIQLVSHKSTSS